MSFDPKNLNGQNSAMGGSAVGQNIPDDIPFDVDIGMKEQVLVEGASADIYNRDEQFDRDRLISLASVEFDKIEYESLLDLFDAKVFEHKLDRTIIQEVYSRADLKNLGPSLEKLENEISSARSRLAAAKVLYQIIRNTERSFIDPERIKNVQKIFNALTKERKENPIVKIPDELEYDLVKTIHELTNIPIYTIPNLPPSYLYMQLLDDIKSYFAEGGHGGLFLHPFQLRNQHFDHPHPAEGKLSKLWELYQNESGRKSLHQVGISKNNSQTDFVFSSRWNNRIPNKKLSPNVQRIAQICSMLANEYRVSAGLGRVAGSKKAIKYGISASKSYPFHNMLGGVNVTHVAQNDTINGSLQDLAIVTKDGNLSSTGASTKVALFDGYVNTKKTGPGYSDVRTAFIDDVKSNPTNNNMGSLDKIIAEAQQIFSEVSVLLEASTCSEQDLNLLTPQGLFVRVLEEFCKLIKYQGYEGDEVARAEQLAGIHILGQTSGVYSDHVNGFSSILKFRLNTYVQRLLARRRNAKGVVLDKQVRLSSRELSKSFNTDLEEVNFDRRLLAETLTAFSQTTMTYGVISAGIDPKSGLLHDPALFKKRFNQDVFKNHTLNQKFNNIAILNGDDILDVNRDLDGSEGFLRGIADIFENMEKEAMTAAGESSFVNLQRLTNLSGLDSALTTALLLECFCLLTDSFARTHLQIGVKTGSTGQVATSDEEGDGLTDITYLQFGDYVSSLRSIKETENANSHIFGNSASDEFVAAFANTETGGELEFYFKNVTHLMKTPGALSPGLSHSTPSERLLMAAGYHGSDYETASGIIKDFDSPQAFIKHVATKLRNRGAAAFATGRHVLLYESGEGDGRQTLLEILAAVKDGDLNQLFGDQNQKAATFLANNGRVTYNGTMAKHDSAFTPNLTLDVVRQLALSHVAPTRLFDVCRAMFMHLDTSTADLSRASAALRADGPNSIEHRGTKVEDPNEQMQALVSLARNQAGRRLIKGFSNRQLEIVEARMQALEAADESQGYIVELLNDRVEQAIRMYLGKLKQSGTRGKFVFYGLPSGKLERLIYNKDAEKIDEEGYDSSSFSSFLDESFEDAVISLHVRALDELQPEIKYKDASFEFPLNITIDSAGVAAGFDGENQPYLFAQLVRLCEFTIDSPLTSGTVKATGNSLIPKYGIQPLRNVLSSFLIKKMSEIAFSLDVSEKETVSTTPFNFNGDPGRRDRTSTATNLMKDLSAVFMTDPKLITTLFNAKPNLKFPTENSVGKFATAHNVSEPLKGLLRPRRELLVSLFNTKPFFDDSIEDYISRPSEFDYIFAVFVDQKQIPIDENKTKATLEGQTALEVRKQYGDHVFSLKTVHTAAAIRNRKTGELL